MDGGYLWLVGSHSAKRKKAESDKTPAENVDRLAKVEIEGNRFTLARVPLSANAEPVAKHESLTAARLSGAVSGDRVFVGLRGPVLRGWAMVIELRVKGTSGGLLALDPIGPAGESYVKHFLQLDGLGVRELSIHGKDLLILAGPSMDLDGPVFIYRWTHALESTRARAPGSLTPREELIRAVTVPFAEKHDHAEGLSIVTRTPLSVLVSYDSPHPSRLDGADGSGVSADIFDVPL